MSTPKLHRVVRFAQTSTRRFRTMQLTIRDWANHRLIAQAQGFPYTGDGEESGESIVKLWLEVDSQRRRMWEAPPARLRFESEWVIATKDEEQWSVVDPRAETIMGSHETASERESILDHAYPYLHFPDVNWLHRPGLTILGSEVVAGRTGVALAAAAGSQDFGILPGSDRHRYVIDVERGVLLRADSFFRGELIGVEEAMNIAFDEELPAHLFEDLR